MSGFDFNLLTQGGPMMWVLLALGALGLMLFIERLLFLHRGQIRSTAFINGIKNILAKRRLVEALTVCEETPGPVAAVVKAALLHADDDAEKMRFFVQEAAVVELPALERRLGSIAALAQVAPLVGLLGTVLGMITTYYAFQKGGDYAMPQALAGGLMQALLSAAGGLMLAIPAHLAHHWLASRVRAIVRDVEWSGNEIMKYLLTEYREAPAAGGAAAPAAPMITRPLDLASRLRPPPRNFDAFFYVNVGLLAVFFLSFGSRFILAPGLGVDFRLPEMAGARAGAARTTCYISIKSSGQILTYNGLLKSAQLPDWLRAAAAASKDPHPALLIVADSAVPVEEITKITSLANGAGFAVHLAAVEPGMAAGSR